MTIPEFSDGFDAAISSYMHRTEFGSEKSIQDYAFDEYEKSLWLTKAQEDIVISLYSGTSGRSFEETEELRRYLANLVVDTVLPKMTNSTNNPIGTGTSSFFTLPDDPEVWFIVYESVSTVGEGSCDNHTALEVVPVTHDEYHKVKKNPFRGVNNRRALRLDLADGVIEIVCSYNVDTYHLRYLKKPSPIVLVNLEGTGLKVEKVDTQTSCELHEALHRRILDRAVALALQSRGYTRTKDNS